MTETPPPLPPSRLRRIEFLSMLSVLVVAAASSGCMEAGDRWGELTLPPLAPPIAQGGRPQLTPIPAVKPGENPSENPVKPGGKTIGAKGKAGRPLRAGRAAKAAPSARETKKAALAKAKAQAKARAIERRKRAAKVIPLRSIVVDPRLIQGHPPRAEYPLPAVFSRIRQLASVGEVRYLRPWLSRRTLDVVERRYGNSVVIPVAPRTLWQHLGGEILGIEYAGSRAIVTLKRKQGTAKLTFYVERGSWRLDLSADGQPLGPAPRKPQISLREATHGIGGRGPLVAVFQTTAGRFRCQLNEALAPETVTQFVGLARGKIGPVNAGGRVRRFYDGLQFHAVTAGRMIQSGDPTGTGRGGAGLTVRDEFDPKLRHDRAGVLALASAGPHTGSSQFYVTLVPAPRLDNRHAIFGQCRDLKVVRQISQAAPNTVTLEKLTIQRGF